jgi:hypothetical protein
MAQHGAAWRRAGQLSALVNAHLVYIAGNPNRRRRAESRTVTRWDVSLMHVARVLYDDARLWPKIWLANLDQISDPDVIHPEGTQPGNAAACFTHVCSGRAGPVAATCRGRRPP